MSINVIVQLYNGGFLPEILLLTQVPIFEWFHGTIIVLRSNIITTLLTMHYLSSVFLKKNQNALCYVWWLCMAINNVSVQYNDGLFPDIILLLTQGYYHWRTPLNAM